MSRKKTILRIENVKKNFQIQNQTVEVLQNINLDVREGQFVSLIGSSGCGKSILLKMITALENQQQERFSLMKRKLRDHQENAA